MVKYLNVQQYCKEYFTNKSTEKSIYLKHTKNNLKKLNMH